MSRDNCHTQGKYSFCVTQHKSTDPGKARELLKKASKRSSGDSPVKPYGTGVDPDPSATVPALCYTADPESATRFDQCAAYVLTYTITENGTPIGTIRVVL